MSSACSGWCGGSSPFQSEVKCSGCLALEQSFFSIHPSQVPTRAQRDEANDFLAPARGLTPVEMNLRFADRFDDTSYPDGFNDGPSEISENCKTISSMWETAKQRLLQLGFMMTGEYPLGHHGEIVSMHVSKQESVTIDGVKLEGPLPMADLCDWLSNPNRVGAVRSWKELLIALSNCCVRMPTNLPPQDWPTLMHENSYHGIDSPERRFTGPFPMGGNMHPFLSTISMLSGKRQSANESLAHIAMTSPGVIKDFGGQASSEWTETLLCKDPEVFRSLFEVAIHPRLVVDRDHRLRLIVLRSGGPASVPVISNPRVWRSLVHSMMFPEGANGANFAKHLFWALESPEADWIPTPPQARSAKLLRETIDSMGRYSSIEPVKNQSGDYSGIFVAGLSGIAYHIEAHPAHQSKFWVTAYPSVSHISRPETVGIRICIDNEKNSEKPLPAGDICASYVLSLRDDINSRYHIFTIDHLLTACELGNDSYEFEGDLDAWWEEVEGHYTSLEEGGFGEEQHYYYEEESEPEMDPQDADEISQSLTEEELEYLAGIEFFDEEGA